MSGVRLRKTCDVFDCPTKCGLPASVLFYMGGEVIVPRCSLNADDFRIALRDILRPPSWRERRVAASAPYSATVSGPAQRRYQFAHRAKPDHAARSSQPI